MSNLERTRSKSIAKKSKLTLITAATLIGVAVTIEIVLLIAHLITVALPLLLIAGFCFVAYKLFLED